MTYLFFHLFPQRVCCQLEKLEHWKWRNLKRVNPCSSTLTLHWFSYVSEHSPFSSFFPSLPTWHELYSPWGFPQWGNPEQRTFVCSFHSYCIDWSRAENLLQRIGLSLCSALAFILSMFCLHGKCVGHHSCSSPSLDLYHFLGDQKYCGRSHCTFTVTFIWSVK